MAFVNCFDVVSMVVEEATSQFAPLWKLNKESNKILEQYCSVIDSLAEEFGGESFDVTSDTYRLLKGYVTTCDLDDPHYRIEAEEIEIIGSDRISLVNFSYYEGDLSS